MIIIPAINCNNFSCVKEKILKIRSLPKNGKWLQFDISDGKFTAAKSWNNPKELKKWAEKNKITLPNLEVHLMVKNPIPEIKKWQAIGAKRFIIHAEIFNNSSFFKESAKGEGFRPILSLVGQGDGKLGLALNPDSKVSGYKELIKQFSFIQILAVAPGYSGQKIKPGIFKKVAQIKKINPKAKIEIDGGMNKKTLAKAKKEGIDFAVSGSYVFEEMGKK